MTSSADADTSGPPLIDERSALWAASLVIPRRRTDRDEIARLRAAVRADLPAIDAAARGWTQLGHTLPPVEARIVGRVSWVRANLTALRGSLEPLRERLGARRALASRVLGVQLGSLLGLLSTKVLGQYVLPLGGPGGGQLLVVGPNVLDLAAEHGELADDVRRMVVLHEVTHRLQFEAAPWLGDHLRGLMGRYLADARIDPAALLDALPRMPDAIARMRDHGSVQPLLETVLTTPQVEVLAEAQGLMSLLEGHGNAAMFDAADPSVIVDPDGVREALARRRGDATSRVLTAVAGLELKRRQYREGEAFVRGVLELGGVEALNLAFARPEHLPGGDEVDDPAAWLARVRAA